jgi:hypothetical protein
MVAAQRAHIYAVVEHVVQSITAARDRATVGPSEIAISVDADCDAKPAFVQQPMVKRAQQCEVVGARLSAVGPVENVVRIDIALVAATLLAGVRL